jgi:hypothetical protein
MGRNDEIDQSGNGDVESFNGTWLFAGIGCHSSGVLPAIISHGKLIVPNGSGRDRLRQWRHSNGSRAAVGQRGIRNIQAVKRLPRYLDGDQAIGRGGDRRRDRSDQGWLSVRTCINNGSKVDNRQRYCRWRECCGDWKHDRRRRSVRLRASDVLRWMVRADRTLARDLHRPSQVHGKCWCYSGALSKGRNFFAIKSEVNDHLRDLASNSREIANEHSPRCKRRHVEHRS